MQDPTHLEAIVGVSVGPVRGKFKLKAELMPVPAQRRIDMKISGGGFGSAVDMTAGADVVDAGDGTTLLSWRGEAIARGPVATIGGRVLDAQAQEAHRAGFGNVRRRCPRWSPGDQDDAARTDVPVAAARRCGRLPCGVSVVAVFKAGTSDKTIDAWQRYGQALEPRPDVPVGDPAAGGSGSQRSRERVRNCTP